MHTRIRAVNALGFALACVWLMFPSAAVQAAPLKGYDATGMAPGNVVFYNSELNLSWTVLQGTTAYVNWAEANAWAESLTLAGTSEWRLPSMLDVRVVADGCDDEANVGSSCGFNVDRSLDAQGRSRSELAYLFHEILGNKAYLDEGGNLQDQGDFNAGPFAPGLVQDFYWFGNTVSEYESWTFDFLLGYQSTRQNSDGAFALAVFDGDVGAVAAVPEPASWLLVLGALAACGWTRRRNT